jgi:hypothetical protein
MLAPRGNWLPTFLMDTVGVGSFALLVYVTGILYTCFIHSVSCGGLLIPKAPYFLYFAWSSTIPSRTALHESLLVRVVLLLHYRHTLVQL